MTYTSEYPIINVAVDLAIFRIGPDMEDQVLLIRRGDEPFKNLLALPGGYLNFKEKPIDGARRECLEETSIQPSGLAFVRMLDHPDRDPRGRVISYLFRGWVPPGTEAVAGDDAAEAHWVAVEVARRETLAFDHKDALKSALGGRW